MTNAIRAARHEVDASGSDVRAAESELRLRIRESYWRLYEALAVLDAVEAGIRGVEAHLKDAQNSFDQGMVLHSDVLVVKSRLSDVRVGEVAAHQDVRMARLRLNQLIGVPLDVETLPADAPDARVRTFDVASLIQTAKSRRAELTALEARRNASESRAQAARAGRFPTVSAVGTYYYARPNPFIFPQEDAFHGTWEAGVAASWDIWNWGATRSDVRRARYAADLASELFAERNDAVELEVSAAALDFDHAAVTLASTDDALEAAREAYRVVQQEHANGVALTSSLLEAEATYREAHVRRARSAAAVAIARASLAYAVGIPEEELR